jgi:DNA-binding MarR family transcriptional regulator
MEAETRPPDEGVFAHATGASYLHLWREVILTYRQFVRRLASLTGYTGAQFEVLRQIAVSDGRSTVSELARELAVDPAAVTRLVAELTRLGLVERESDAADGRRRPVVLTDEGRRRMAELHAVLHEHEARLTAGLDPEEIETATKVLRAVRAAVDSMPRRPA